MCVVNNGNSQRVHVKSLVIVGNNYLEMRLEVNRTELTSLGMVRNSRVDYTDQDVSCRSICNYFTTT